MDPQGIERRLTTILAADVVGYARLMAGDEAGTLAQLKAHRKELIEPKTGQYHGRVVKLMGDGVLMEFVSVVDAVSFAADVQREMERRNAAVPEDRRIVYRIGINIGDIIVDGDDIYGDGVNVASRLEALAEPGGICVAQDVYNQVRNKVALGFEDAGAHQVKNIPEPIPVYRVRPAPATAGPATAAKATKRTGWRWAGAAAAIVVVGVGALAMWLRPWAPDVEPASVERMAFPLPDKPSIAVLPFVNLSGDPGQDLFSDGITNDIITDLSRFADLMVIASNSTFSYKGKPTKVQQVAEELGVRYVLEGSIQRVGDAVRVNVQFVDAISGEHLWAERYDRELSDIFATQDEITQKVVATLGAYEGRVAEADRAQAKRKETTDLSVYELVLLARELRHHWNKGDNAKSRELLEHAVRLDPQYARAHVGLAWTHLQDAINQYTKSTDVSLTKAQENATKAIQIDDSFAEGHWVLAEIYLAIGKPEKGVAAYERALALNPNHADILAAWAMVLPLVLGKTEEGIETIRRAMRLSPFHAEWYDRVLMVANFAARQYEDVISAYQALKSPTFNTRLMLAASYAHAGRLEEARGQTARMLELRPDFSIRAVTKSISTWLFHTQVEIAHIRDGLRKSGLPEKPPLALPAKPSIAVLPFANLSGDPEQEYFVDGVANDIITDLSKFSTLFVIAANSSFTYKGRPVRVQDVARDLGVRYVLEGSVQKTGDKLRINAQLVDATTGRHAWAESYDRDAQDLFSVQKGITQRIVSAVASAEGSVLNVAELERIARIPTQNLKAHELVLRGLWHVLRETREDTLLAHRMFDQAIQLDPSYARAYAEKSMNHLREIMSDWTQSREETLEKAEQFAQSAIDLDNTDYNGYLAMGWTVQLQGRVDQGIAMYEKAYAANPNAFRTSYYLGFLLIYSGKDLKRGLELFEKSTRLSPIHEEEFTRTVGQMYFFAGKYEKAISSFDIITRRHRTSLWLYLAASYAQLDRMEEARAAIAEALKLKPDLSLQREVSRRQANGLGPKNAAHLREALRKAGLPE